VEVLILMRMKSFVLIQITSVHSKEVRVTAEIESPNPSPLHKWYCITGNRKVNSDFGLAVSRGASRHTKQGERERIAGAERLDGHGLTHSTSADTIKSSPTELQQAAVPAAASHETRVF
jgi:hypothetical protein